LGKNKKRSINKKGAENLVLCALGKKNAKVISFAPFGSVE
jgi:hypothetical protein